MMSCIRRIYDCSNRNISPSSSHHYELKEAPKLSCCARITNNFVWTICRPFVWTHALYSGIQLGRKQELSELLLNTVDQKRPITPFPFPNMMLYIVNQGMGVFLKAPRNDNTMFKDKVNYEVFLPILNDILQQIGQGKEVATPDDFLLTSGRDKALEYREVILEIMGPKFSKTIHNSLEELSELIHRAIPADGNVQNADDFCGELTAAMISKLFLNHPGPYKEIYWALAQIDKLAMQRRWVKLSAHDEKDYQNAIQIISSAIKIAETDERPECFVGLMKSRGLTRTQIRGMLFLVYTAGSGTTTTAVKYLLWQLGQHPEQQAAISNSNYSRKGELISKAISEALRLAPPVGIIGRFAAKDLIFKISEKGRVIYSYTIPKGSGLLLAPLIAAKDKGKESGFDIEQVKNSTLFPWLPFSAGFHGCPGKPLALAELSTIMSKLLNNYTFTSYPNQPDLKRHQFMNLRHPEKVSFKFTRIAY